MAKIALLQLGQRTTDYYQQRLEQKPTLIDVDFDSINTLLPDQQQPIIELFNHSILPLVKSFVKHNDVNQLIVPNITLHEYIDQLAPWFQALCIHPVKQTIQQLLQQQHQQIVLIGSMYSMNANYLHGYFYQHGIQVVRPSLENQNQIDDYRRKVYQTIETDVDTNTYQQLLHDYSKTTPVVIACTELSLALAKVSNSGIYDMVDIQINATESASESHEQ